MKSENTNLNIQKRWLSPDELYDEFGFKTTNQSHMRRERRIPFSKVGSSMYAMTGVRLMNGLKTMK